MSSGALVGIDAVAVNVEVDTAPAGEVKVFIVGLPDAAVKESNDRVWSALPNSGFRVPDGRVTVNLAPGDLRKEGPIYDLPMALGMIHALGQEELDGLQEYIFGGELSLSGELRPIKGGLALARLAKAQGRKGVVLPPVSASEAALVEGIESWQVHSLDEAVRFLRGEAAGRRARPVTESADAAGRELHLLDFSEVKGQHAVRRAVELAVAGGHCALLIGPPGSGKSMIAKRIPSIMPEPTLDEFLDILAVHSAAGQTLRNGFGRRERPFRSPHHTISDVGLLGGGSIPGPGEISLAHNGVLFLDELPEFKRSALEVLRQPLEDGEVTISRSAAKVTLPCSFMLVAAMNPCPCGYLGDAHNRCRCSAVQVQRYRSRISGPLLDRIDIHVEAPALTINEMRSGRNGEDSRTIRERVEEARRVQAERFRGAPSPCNARMSQREIRRHCAIDANTGDLLQSAMEELSLSARAYDRILKVARTIADLAGAESIATPHVLEAIQYRSLDRRVFY